MLLYVLLMTYIRTIYYHKPQKGLLGLLFVYVYMLMIMITLLTFIPGRVNPDNLRASATGISLMNIYIHSYENRVITV